MLHLESAAALLLPGLVIENIEAGDVSTGFDVKYRDLTERVIINTPSYRKSSNIAFHPICIEMVGKNGVVMSFGNHIDNKRITVFVNNYLDHDFRLVDGHLPDDIWISDIIQTELNKYLKYPITDNLLSIHIIEKNMSHLIENVPNIPLSADPTHMLVYGIDEFIVESLNAYIKLAYVKFQKNPNGYNPTSMTSYLRDLLTSQITQYVEKCPSDIQKEILEADSEDKIVLPTYCIGLSLVNNVFVAQNDGPQSHDSGRVVHKFISTSIENYHFVCNTPFIPFSRLQASSPYCRNIFQNRMQVRRACTTQNLDLISNDPLVIAERAKELPLPGITMHVAYFQWGYTLEDGIIVSRSAADKLTGFKVHVDTFEVDMSDIDQVEMKLSSLENATIQDIIHNYRQYFNANSNCRYRRKGIIAVTPKGIVRTTAKIPGIVFEIKMSDYEYQTNTGSGALVSKRFVFTVKSILRYKLDIGDKLAGYFHGNKGTIAAIIPDNEMPMINGVRVDIVMDPSICKRGIPSVVFECHDSIVARENNKPMFIDCLETYNRDFSKCYGSLEFDHDTYYEGAASALIDSIMEKGKTLHGFIRMSRLDHNSVEKLTYTNHVRLGQTGQHNAGAITLPGIQYVLYAKGCDHALKEVMSSNSIVGSINNYLHVLGLEMSDFLKGDN